MKSKLMILCACSAALFACGEAPEGDYDSEVPERAADAPSPAAYVMGPGNYAIEGGEGTVYSQTQVNADGSYIDLDPDGNEVGRGTWRDDRGSSCFDPEGDGPEQQERCWTNSALGQDGTFTTTRDDGSESYTVRPLGRES